MITATQIKIGQILNIDSTLYKVLKVQHITPGKGNAVVQTELRNLKTGNKDNIRFRSAETVAVADVLTRNVNFLYQDGSAYHFMDPLTFEQIEINETILRDVAQFLLPETSITVSTYDGNPVSISIPQKMTFEVIECDPPTKGMAGAFKDAKLANEMTTKVPLFIKVGDKVVINTDTGDYMEKGD